MAGRLDGVWSPGGVGLSAYFQIGMPVLCHFSSVLGYLAPDRSWRWGAIPLGTETAWMLVTQGMGNLWPLGLIADGVLAVPPMLASRLGALLRRRRTP